MVGQLPDFIAVARMDLCTHPKSKLPIHECAIRVIRQCLYVVEFKRVILTPQGSITPLLTIQYINTIRSSGAVPVTCLNPFRNFQPKDGRLPH